MPDRGSKRRSGASHRDPSSRSGASQSDPSSRSGATGGDRSPRRASRRRVLATSALATAGLVGFAGCSRPRSDASESTTTATQTTTGSRPTTRPTVDSDWPRAHFDAANADVAPAGAGPRSAVGVAWTTSVGDAAYGPPSAPVVVDDVVYCSHVGTLYAFDDASGEVAWTTTLSADGGASTTPTVVDGTLYVNDGRYGGNHLHAVDAASGEATWTVAYGTRDPGPVNVDATAERAYFGTFGQDVHAIDVVEPTEQWDRGLLVRADSMPAVDDDAVYVGFYDPLYPGGVLAFDALTGTLRWRFREPEDGGRTTTTRVPAGTTARSTATTASQRVAIGGAQFQPAVALDADTAYFASKRGGVYAIETDAGDVRWSFRTRGGVTRSPTVTDDVVIVTDSAGVCYGVNATDGRERWRVPLVDDRARVPVFPSAVVAGDVAYVSLETRVLALDVATGVARWRATLDDAVSVEAVANGRLYGRTFGGLAVLADSNEN